MSAKPSTGEISIAESLNVQDEKIGKVVEEVDRFFRSVHANIEDWKFAMEDDGDGTRIFVRFQIHLNMNGASSHSGTAEARRNGSGVSRARGGGAPADGESRPSRDRRAATASGRTADLRAATVPETDPDPDLGPIVKEWKRKRDGGPRMEFHVEGAPFLDAPPERRSRKRSRGHARKI
jgi:hypothetical protein